MPLKILPDDSLVILWQLFDKVRKITPVISGNDRFENEALSEMLLTVSLDFPSSILLNRVKVKSCFFQYSYAHQSKATILMLIQIRNGQLINDTHLRSFTQNIIMCENR